MLDVIDGGGHGAFVDGDDARGHLFGRHAGIGPDHAYDRDIDVGEDIGGHAGDGGGAEDEHEDRHHDEGIGPAQRKFNDPHEYLRGSWNGCVWPGACKCGPLLL